MAESVEALWKRAVTVLDPWRVLKLGEVDALYCDRPDRPADAIFTRIRRDEAAAVKVLLCGSRGSGKTTELLRLARRARDRCTCVLVDIGALPEPTGTLAIATVLGVAALAELRVWDAAAASTGAPATALQAAIGRFTEGALSLSRLVGAVASALGVVGVDGAGAVATGAGAISAGATALRELSVPAAQALQDLDQLVRRVPQRIPVDRHDDAASVVLAVNAVLDALEQASQRPVLLLADGLDKRTRLEHVFAALDDAHLLNQLRAGLVLTGPVSLRHDPRFALGVPGKLRPAEVQNLPIWRRHGDAVTLSPDGTAVLSRLYRARAEGAGFEPDALVAPEAIARAAAASSGIPRQFLDLLNTAADRALEADARRVDLAHLDAAMREHRHRRQFALKSDDVALLQGVLATGVLPQSDRADTLLYENAIACYANGDVWYRPNDLIVQWLETIPRG